MTNIAIIGGGASGVLTAIHILKASQVPVVITIYEPSKELGAGLAYSTTLPEHILNVPAEKMSFDEENPGDFVEWLKVSSPQSFGQTTYPFVSRMLFKSYLQQRLKDYQGIHTVEWVKEKVVRVHRANTLWNIETKSTSKKVNHCVIATGYERQMLVPRSLEKMQDALEVNPYDGDLSPHAYSDVAIIGTGLTAIDIWRSLRKQHFVGKVHFVSRRAQFPQSFTTTLEYSSSKAPRVSQSPRDFMRFVRRLMESTPCDGGSIAQWMRPFVTEIWGAWSLSEKKQFLNHVRPYWDSIRHRLPDVVFSDLQKELQSGRSSLSKASRLDIQKQGARFRMTVSTDKHFDVDKIFIATGARLNLQPFEIEPEYLLECELKQGFVENAPGLSIIGPPSRTTFWEATAVPEIRRQAQQLAQIL